MKKSTLRTTAAWQALALLGAGVPAAFIAATPAAAQDYTAGAVTGTVTSESGAPVAGATVVMTSKSQGFTRTATTTSSGTFSFSGIPGGYYDVTVAAAGNAPFRATDVTVLAGQSSDLTISLTAATSADADEVVVIGSRIQAFSGTTTGLNVNVEELTKAVPLGRTLTDIILLAPGTTQGDSAFGNLASIGGSSVAENAYYVNGLNITNFDNYLGSSNVPFDMYKSVEVKSGGYPAEFGRATGGIVNAVTKSGTNDFMAALHLNWNPDFLRGTGKDIETCSYNDSTNPAAGTTCSLATNRGFDESDSYSAVMEAGGPLIRDRLFAYGLLEVGKSESTIVSRSSGIATNRTNDDPFYGIKLDAYPIDDHHFEFTLYDNRNTTRANYLSYSEDANGLGSTGLAGSVQDFKGGGVSFVGKYTGRFTDWLTLSAAYGRMRDRFDNVGVAGDAALPAVRNFGSDVTLSDGTVVPYLGFTNGQTVASTSFPYNTERKFYRADADMYFTAMGEHHIRIGFDREDNDLEEAAVRTGGTYLNERGILSDTAYNFGYGNAGLYYQLLTPTILQINYFNSSGVFGARNQAYYAQDEWSVTDRLTLSLGVRRDDFTVRKADGSDYVTQKENYAPRLGLTYDLFDDKRGKFKAFYGQYYLPFASNTAFRQVGSEVYVRERFRYNGFDGDGIPILTSQFTGSATYQGTCPFALTNYAFSTGQHCNVTGDGSVADSTALIDANLKATKETEWILGYEHKLGSWRAGINYTNRRLNETAEDVAIDAAVLAYCDANGITGCSSTWTGFHQYVITNPGNDMVVALDGLDGRTVTLTAADLQYPKAVRKYDAVEFTMSRPFDGTWTAGGSYTWSKSRGNSEGFVQSDFGQDDAGITQDFDQPGFTDGAYGPLPNDRRHRIKLWGSYRFMDALTLGTNISIASPRPLSCFGYHPTDPFANAYGAASHYCGGVLAPRGQGSETDWLTDVDFKAAYDIKMPTGQLLTLRADVFNLFNSQAVTSRNETGEIDNGTDYIANPSYDLANGYQAPRSVRLGLDISF